MVPEYSGRTTASSPDQTVDHQSLPLLKPCTTSLSKRVTDRAAGVHPEILALTIHARVLKLVVLQEIVGIALGMGSKVAVPGDKGTRTATGIPEALTF